MRKVQRNEEMGLGGAVKEWALKCVQKFSNMWERMVGVCERGGWREVRRQSRRE